nr:hypothetical protein [Tanacetum cinerariifolium]
MSSDEASFEVTYTSISSNYEDPSDVGSPGVVIYGYDGLPMHPVDPPSPDYMPSPEEPEYSQLSPDYVPGLEYPEYLVPSDEEIPVKDQPYVVVDSPIALSPGYIAESGPKEDPEGESEDGPIYYSADRGDGDDDDDSSNNDEEEEEHLALVNPVILPVVDHVPSSKETRSFVTDESAATSPSPPIEFKRLLALPTPPPSLLISLSPPSVEERLSRCLAAHVLPSSPLPQIPSPPLPPLPSSLYLPPHVPTSLPLPSPPLPPLPASPFITPPVDRREDIPELDLLEVIEQTMGLSALWMPRPDIKEPRRSATTIRMSRQNRLLQTINVLIEDKEFHQETALLMDQEALISREAWATALGQIQALQARDPNHNNIPPKRTFATTRADAAAASAADGAVVVAAPMTVAAVDQLIEARVSTTRANHKTLRNSTNGHGDGSHNSDTGIRGTIHTPRECTYNDFLNCKPLTFKGTEGVVVLSQWFEKMESVFHISNCALENQVKFATCTFLGNALTWGKIKKLEFKLWNLKVKGTDVASYTLRFQELALMCGRILHKESDEVEKYIGGIPDMIWVNVMSYQPKTMEKAIDFANDQMDQKVLTIAERQAEQKRKLEYNVGNNQGHQQQNKRQNTERAYTAGPGEKREYTGSLPLSSGPNANNNNHGNFETTQNASTCYECGVQGNFKRDCPKLKNKNHVNQGGNGNAPVKVYDWDDLLDFNFDDIPLLFREEPQQFMCKIGKSTRNKKKAIENLNYHYHDIGTSSSAGGHLTQEEATKEDLAIKMSQKLALLKEVMPVIKTMAYLDKYKKLLDEVRKVKIELDGMAEKKEEEAVKKIKSEALKEKNDPGAFIFPIRMCFQIASKDLDSILESQRLDKNKEGLGYNVVPPSLTQIYSPPKKDMSWTGLLEFADDTITDYSRPSPTIESNTDDTNRNSSVTETRESSSIIISKLAIKFVKAADRPTEDKTDKVKIAKKPTVKYAKLYRRTSKSSKVRRNQRNWNNLKSQQLGENFVKKNKACFNCGHFDHLSYDCRLWVKMGRACLKNNYTHKSMPPRAVVHKTVRSPTRTNRSNMNVTQPRRTNFPKTKHSYVRRPFQETTQDLMIILIQRVKMLEKELKARTPPTKVYKVDRGRSMPVMAWVPKKV